MSKPATAKLSADDRAIFGAIADFLIPKTVKMPAATEVGVAAGGIDDVLKFRPDLIEDFHRGLEKAKGLTGAKAAEQLFETDKDAFGAVSLAASGAYYMAPKVRQIIGYPGQESLTYDNHETPDYLTNGMLERVARRGPTYKPTPK
ncbi:hypothetical protein [Hypericibacter sp.]|uniref:hypothetical protein n=1 Tax=Hypericibacter sp. TaxID=2705401 RepID=UPI003D6D4931